VCSSADQRATVIGAERGAYHTLPPFVNLPYLFFDSATFRIAFVSPGIIARQEGMKVLVLSSLYRYLRDILHILLALRK